MRHRLTHISVLRAGTRRPSRRALDRRRHLQGGAFPRIRRRSHAHNRLPRSGSPYDPGTHRRADGALATRALGRDREDHPAISTESSTRTERPTTESIVHDARHSARWGHCDNPGPARGASPGVIDHRRLQRSGRRRFQQSDPDVHAGNAVGRPDRQRDRRRRRPSPSVRRHHRRRRGQHERSSPAGPVTQSAPGPRGSARRHRE